MQPVFRQEIGEQQATLGRELILGHREDVGLFVNRYDEVDRFGPDNTRDFVHVFAWLELGPWNPEHLLHGIRESCDGKWNRIGDEYIVPAGIHQSGEIEGEE